MRRISAIAAENASRRMRRILHGGGKLNATVGQIIAAPLGCGRITGYSEVILAPPAKSAFYEQVTRVKGLVFLSFHSLGLLLLLFVVVDPHRCLSTVFLFAL